MFLEPELRGPPPRPVSLTPASRARLLASLAGPPAVIAACAWVFFSGPQAFWVEASFAACIVLGGALVYRVSLLWLERVRLVREGETALAVVVRKEPARRGRARFQAWYEGGGRQWGANWKGDAQSAGIGDAVSVLYDEAEPQRCVVYAAAGCVARAPKAASSSEAVSEPRPSPGAGD